MSMGSRVVGAELVSTLCLPLVQLAHKSAVANDVEDWRQERLDAYPFWKGRELASGTSETRKSSPFFVNAINELPSKSEIHSSA